jgi:hypothetical protein
MSFNSKADSALGSKLGKSLAGPSIKINKGDVGIRPTILNNPIQLGQEMNEKDVVELEKYQACKCRPFCTN